MILVEVCIEFVFGFVLGKFLDLLYTCSRYHSGGNLDQWNDAELRAQAGDCGGVSGAFVKFHDVLLSNIKYNTVKNSSV